METNIKNPQELHDEYKNIELVHNKELYKKTTTEYKKSQLSDFEQFLDNNCPFFIKNGTCKNTINDNDPLAYQANFEIRRFMKYDNFVLDLPDDENKYIAYSTDRHKNKIKFWIEPKYEIILMQAGWRTKYVSQYPDNKIDQINVNPTGKVYARFALIPIIPIKKILD